MGKNVKGGSKHKKYRAPGSRDRRLDSIRKNPDPEEHEEYGKVVRPAGNRRFQVIANKSSGNECWTIICKLRGSFSTRVKAGDYVLVKYYGFSEQAQIVDVYTSTEVKMLQEAKCWDFNDVDVSGIPEPDDSLNAYDSDESDDVAKVEEASSTNIVTDIDIDIDRI
jgi:translation initiation factor IF-1